MNNMKAYDESMYWMTNDKWFRINHERDCFELTDEAPQRTVESFKMYLLRNDLPILDASPSRERIVDA